MGKGLLSILKAIIICLTEQCSQKHSFTGNLNVFFLVNVTVALALCTDAAELGYPQACYLKGSFTVFLMLQFEVL